MISRFKNNHRLHLPSSQHRSSANVFRNGANTGLAISSQKQTAWNSRQMLEILWSHLLM